jgi:hypothetical protein
MAVKKYRVWYRRNDNGLKSCVEIEATSVKEAKRLVESSIPGTKATQAWLIEK